MTRRLSPILLCCALLVAAVGPRQDMSYTLEAAERHRATLLDAGSPGFDNSGSAYVRSGGVLTIVRPRRAVRTLDLDEIARAAIERDVLKGERWDGLWDKGTMVDTSVVGDAEGRVYTLIIPRYSKLRSAVLLWSADRGRTWHAVALAGRNATMERPDSYNDHGAPPTILSFERYGGRTERRLWLERLTVSEDRIVPAGPPLLLSDRSLLVGNHSGAANSTFTTRDRIIAVYDVDDGLGQGTLSVAREVDRTTGRLGPERQVGRSTTAQAPDMHDIPAITAGPDGHLVVMIGAHHAWFLMFRSRQPGTTAGGWIPEGPVGKEGSATGTYSYISLATSRDGTMNVVARGEDGRARYSLVQLRKPWGKPWTRWPNGSIRRVLAEPNRAHYAAWRQRMTMDLAGQLYLNFRYYPNMLTDAEARTLGVAGGPRKDCDKGGLCWYADAPELTPRTLVSSDNGVSWR
ncbi:hypothetical protein PMI02_01517 [Novosphingobium sp. AP12]|nr:hypothetical protein PMI02_01517 [Novosphingobium sp. AP12]